MSAKRYRISIGSYRLLLRLYPRRFRARFEEALVADFEQMLAETGSRFQSFRRLLGDVIWSVPRERLRARSAAVPRRSAPWTGLVQETRHAARGLLKAPLYSGVSVLTLALGIGATTAIFSLVRATLLEPLPFADPERLVALWEKTPGDTSHRNSISPANYQDWKLRLRSFDAMAAYDTQHDTITGDDVEPEMVTVGLVAPDFFSVLGLTPTMGRDLRADEAAPGNQFVVLLSAEYWERRFGSSPHVLGRSLAIDRERYEIVGVMPADIGLPSGVALWRPLALPTKRWTEQRGSHFLSAVARLRPGVRLERAQAELEGLVTNLALEYPRTNEGWGAMVLPLREDLVADVRASLLLLQASVLFVLAIAAVNVMGLQLSRAASRRSEMAIRVALGAGSARLSRLVVVESTLVSLVGGLLGLAVSLAVVALLRPMAPVPVPPSGELLLNAAVLGFAVAVSVGAGLLLGVAIALAEVFRVRRPEINAAARGIHARGRARQWLVTTEVALSLVLLVGAGLFVKSFYQLVQVDAGVDAENVLSLRVTIPSAEYQEPLDRMGFFEKLHVRLSELPGVRSAGLTTLLPVTGSEGWWRNTFHRPEHPPETPAEQTTAYLRWVSPGYMKAAGIPLLRGRDIEESDTATTPNVMLIDEAMARAHFANEDPIGRRIVVQYNDWEAEIVGIVGNTRQTSLRDGHEPHMYLPYRQTYAEMHVRSMVAVLRTDERPHRLAGPARAIVRELDPFLAPVEVETLAERLSGSVREERFQLTIVSAFAGCALVLALVGLYGVIAYLVSQRRREVGVRMALGAQARDVLTLVLRQGGGLVVSGLIAGLLGTAALASFVAPLLFEVSANDISVLVAASTLLLVVGLTAVWLPARSAARLDPMSVLRSE